jgi:hypothetical protein
VIRFVKRPTATPAKAAPPTISARTFVVVHVRHALQHAGAIGAYSAARFVIGASRTESLRITASKCRSAKADVKRR